MGKRKKPYFPRTAHDFIQRTYWEISQSLYKVYHTVYAKGAAWQFKVS